MRIALPRTSLRIVTSSRPAMSRCATFFGVGPRRVAVRVVGLERDVVDADRVERLQAVRVVEEAAVDVLVVVLRRRALSTLSATPPQPRLSSHTLSARSST